MHTPHTPLRTLLTPLAAALLLALPTAQAQTTAAPSATEAALMQRLDQLAAELAALKGQLTSLQQQRGAATAAPVPAGATPAVPAAVAATTAVTASASTGANGPGVAGPATVLTSYGEINYNRPRRNAQATNFDMRRFVLGYQHRIDEYTKVVAELEVEHAIASASDGGEVAIEQAYVERQLSPTWAARGGLFLMPVGLLNENHEPTAFLGVERNFVETAIIPTTWREGGVQIVGNFDNGLTLQGGVSSGFDLGKWDATSSDGRASPLGAVHQELAQAKGRQLAVFGAANWRGLPGLLLGASLFSGGATPGQAAGPQARTTLWEAHGRWTPGRWDLSALYARGSISNTAALNLPLVGSDTLIPQTFDGGYVQAGYRAWQRGDLALTPFLRWEEFNTGRRYADLGAGLTPTGLATEQVWTLGANLQVAPGIVIKADWQRFRRDRDADRSNLGLGWSF
jgi:hypothetical protein